MKRTRSPASPAPPLWLWAASAALALGLVGASLPSFLAHQAQARRLPTSMDVAIAKNAEEAPRDASILRVIAFGDSALATAALQGKAMTAYIKERTGRDVSFLLLWRPWCLLHHILASVDAAIATSPDVVMLDSWTLVHSLDRDSTRRYRAFLAERPDVFASLQRVADRPSLLFEHQAYLFDALTGATQGQQRIEAVPAPASAKRPGPSLVCNESSRRQKLREVDRRYPEFGETIVAPEVRQTLETLLDRADAHGVRIVFFDIPKAPPVEGLPGVQRKRAATRQLLHEYVESGRIDYLEYDGQIDTDDTCDYVHYGAAGRERYLPWFADHLARLQDGPR